ncbi:MAG TPA: M28 family peptidase [Solirubrobacteraceae bacterium]|nr:M28 family peptidase [Solirubrobacteraceae bacterium]
MFDGRIYRAALAPLLLVVVIVGFSLTGAAAPLHSTLAPDAFDGGRAYATLRQLLSAYPDRKPGSAGDQGLAADVAGSLRGLAGAAGGGFRVSTHSFSARTAEGQRTLTDVIAVRPGSSGERPIAIIAHRDAVQRGSAAELSGTAALLELARVFAQSETKRTVVLVSTSGGSEGNAGAAYYAAHLRTAPDAAIVLGDLAGDRAHKPFVLSFSSGTATAPGTLQRTLQGTISQEVGTDPGSVGLSAQVAQLAQPLALGEQAPLNDAAIPAVTVQVSGPRGPVTGTLVSESRLSNFGRAVLAAIYALDEGPDIAHAPSTRLELGARALPEWAIRLLVLAALLAPLVVCVDAFARLRRRRAPLARGLLWGLCGALPFLVAALFVAALGALGILSAPSAELSVTGISAVAGAPVALVATLLVLGAMTLARPALLRRFGFASRPDPDATGLSAMLVLLAVALLAWLIDPFAGLLLVPAAHLGLLAADSRPRALSLLALGVALLPLAALLFVVARELGLAPIALAESVILALAGGQLGLFSALLWSLALGSLFSLLALVLADRGSERVEPLERLEISTRGPLSYAGPGSLGGTESALHH